MINYSFIEELNLLNSNWKSNSRIFGAAIENWVQKNIVCECSGNFENQLANQKSIDAICNNCGKKIQIKASNKNFKPNLNNELKIMGAEYKTTLKSIQDGNDWDLILVAYDKNKTIVTQILKILSKDINITCVVPRKKLSLTARRAGWQGCYLNFRWDIIKKIYHI